MRKFYYVQTYKGLWVVVHDSKVLSSFLQKTDAIAEGRRVARANAPSELVIRNSDGTIAERETYGSDPFPPRG